jgi:virginiamycin B lyase
VAAAGRQITAAVKTLSAAAWTVPRRTVVVVAVAAMAWAAGTADAGATAPYVQYRLPRPAMGPCDVSVDQGGTEWVEDFIANTIGRIDPRTGAFAEYPVPTPLAVPGGLQVGPDGNMWFPEFATGKIAQLNTVTGRVSEYPIPDLPSELPGLSAAIPPLPGRLALADDISSGPDGAMWFTEIGGNSIGRIDLRTHAISQFPLPTVGAAPINIDHGPGDTLLIGEFGAGKIGQLNVFTHQLTEYPLPTPVPAPFDATVGAGGAIWFVAQNPAVIGRIDPATRTITEYRVRVPSQPIPGPGSIVSAGDGNLWFRLGGSIFPVDTLTSRNVARFDPHTHVLTVFNTPGFCDLQFGAPGRGTDRSSANARRWLWGGEFTGQAVLALDTKAADSALSGARTWYLRPETAGFRSVRRAMIFPH